MPTEKELKAAASSSRDAFARAASRAASARSMKSVAIMEPDDDDRASQAASTISTRVRNALDSHSSCCALEGWVGGGAVCALSRHPLTCVVYFCAVEAPVSEALHERRDEGKRGCGVVAKAHSSCAIEPQSTSTLTRVYSCGFVQRLANSKNFTSKEQEIKVWRTRG